MRPFVLAGLAVAWGLFACSHAPSKPIPFASAEAAETRLAIAEDVQKRFQVAEREYRRGQFAEAQASFEALRTKYPYSPEAVRSELREADLLFCQSRFIESAEAYKAFVRFHPRHPETGYARLEAAESYLAQVPKEWWFLPPVAEKDQQILRQTIEAYDDLMASGPTPRQAERAKAARAQCQTQLAKHELYVARFYLRRKAFAGALARAEALLQEPQPADVAREALAMAAAGALGAHGNESAQRFWRQLARDYPDSREGQVAKERLGQSAEKAEKD